MIVAVKIAVTLCGLSVLTAMWAGVVGSSVSKATVRDLTPSSGSGNEVTDRSEGGTDSYSFEDPLGVPPAYVPPVHFVAGGIGVYLAWLVNKRLIEGRWVFGLVTLCGYLAIMLYAIAPVIVWMFE